MEFVMKITNIDKKQPVKSATIKEKLTNMQKKEKSSLIESLRQFGYNYKEDTSKSVAELKSILNWCERGDTNNSSPSPITESIIIDPMVKERPYDVQEVATQLSSILTRGDLDIYIDSFLGGYTITLIGKRANGDEVEFWSSNIIKDSKLSEQMLEFIKQQIDNAIGYLDSFNRRYTK